tara:strand:- start:1419 stop:1559 length:141 start_codon:yes stop_codon:yes gene_type:complete
MRLGLSHRQDAFESIDKAIKILEENEKIIDDLQLDIDKLSDLHKEL